MTFAQTATTADPVAGARGDTREHGHDAPGDRLFFGRGKRTPVILQTEAAECGLACLAMVAAYHGHETTLPALRRRFSLSLKGITATRLIEMADALGLQCRPLRLETDEIGRLQTPCILHWDLDHFVVLRQAPSVTIVVRSTDLVSLGRTERQSDSL